MSGEERKKNEGRFHSLTLSVWENPDSKDLFNKIKDPAKKAKVWNKWNTNRINSGLPYVKNPFGFDDLNALHNTDRGPLLSSLDSLPKQAPLGGDSHHPPPEVHEIGPFTYVKNDGAKVPPMPPPGS